MRIKSVEFKNYKAFQHFTVTLSEFDVLVGPNNAGKSTVLGAFRLLAEALRRANSRKAERLGGATQGRWGYRLDLADVSISLENVFHDYNDDEPATITFVLENGNRLRLEFPEKAVCFLFPEGPRSMYQPATFREDFPVKVSFVPVLGPVEHEETLNLKETARRALLTHRASRNFRNIWHHFPESFEQFRELIKTTWPGMDIQRPEVLHDSKDARLVMFCPEERYPREIYWAGFGFQVWCQLLTFMLRAKDATLLIVDEPDIYLHADLQRQLVSILKELGPHIILATHSVEIISEVEADCLVSIHKRNRRSRRISSTKDLHQVFQVLGTNANPTLTQLAKTRRVLFVEGKDFSMISGLARRAGLARLATRSDFAVVAVDGFNPERVLNLAKGMELTLGAPIVVGVVFDRDYRSQDEVESVLRKLRGTCVFVEVHQCKEIENYLLASKPLQRAINDAMQKQVEFGQKGDAAMPDATALIDRVMNTFKSDVMAQFITRRTQGLRAKNPGLAIETANAQAIREFETLWSEPIQRLRVVPGKDTLARVNEALQAEAGIAISKASLIAAFTKVDLPADLLSLLNGLESFRKQQPKEG